MISFTKELVAIFVIVILIFLLINSPGILADIFIVLFNFVSQIVIGIQIFVLDVFNQIF